MFAWLRGPSKIDKAIAAEEYGKAIDLIRAEIARDPESEDTRSLQQTMAELMAKTGQKEEAVRILRDLMLVYSDLNMHTKAIALHKLMWQIDIKVADRMVEDIAKKVVESVKPLDLSPAAATAGRSSERVTATVAHTPLFGDLEKDEVRALIQGLKLETLGPGDVIMVEGEPGDSLFILTDGQVRVNVRSASGKSKGIRNLYAGSFFGEISIVYGKPRTATITCKTTCELLELDKATLTTITATHPGIEKVLKEFCDQRMKSVEEIEGRTA